jgi:post-segregation antitoxin (ccd killing protein)
MPSDLNLKMVTVMAVPEHWEQFTALARAQGLSISALLRQMVAREVRRAARQK